MTAVEDGPYVKAWNALHSAAQDLTFIVDRLTQQTRAFATFEEGAYYDNAERFLGVDVTTMDLTALGRLLDHVDEYHSFVGDEIASLREAMVGIREQEPPV